MSGINMGAMSRLSAFDFARQAYNDMFLQEYSGFDDEDIPINRDPIECMDAIVEHFRTVLELFRQSSGQIASGMHFRGQHEGSKPFFDDTVSNLDEKFSSEKTEVFNTFRRVVSKINKRKNESHKTGLELFEEAFTELVAAFETIKQKPQFLLQ